MICEQFVYGLFTKAGYKTLKSSQVDKLLTKQSFEQLKSLRLPSNQESTYVQMYFSTEDMITFTYLQATKDTYGRKGILHHTIFMRTADFFQQFPEALNYAFEAVKNYLPIDPTNPPATLEAIRL